MPEKDPSSSSAASSSASSDRVKCQTAITHGADSCGSWMKMEVNKNRKGFKGIIMIGSSSGILLLLSEVYQQNLSFNCSR